MSCQESQKAIIQNVTRHTGGLTENDFIVASRMNSTDVKELLAKKKTRYAIHMSWSWLLMCRFKLLTLDSDAMSTMKQVLGLVRIEKQFKFWLR